MERVEAIVSGRVQFVMYRDFVCRMGRKYGLVGCVQNKKDGTVSVIAEGTKENLEKFLTRLHTGPLLSDVKNVVATFKPATGEYTKFTLVYEWN